MARIIRWMAAVYRVTDGESLETRSHIGVPESGRQELERMLRTAEITEVLAALYLPKSTPAQYVPGAGGGRLIGIAKVKKLPRNKRVDNYGYPDLEGKIKWPIGFPCKIVCYPSNVKDCPSLRDLIEEHRDGKSFRRYTRELHLGPIELQSIMQNAISEHFDRMNWVSGGSD